MLPVLVCGVINAAANPNSRPKGINDMECFSNVATPLPSVSFVSSPLSPVVKCSHPRNTRTPLTGAPEASTTRITENGLTTHGNGQSKTTISGIKIRNIVRGFINAADQPNGKSGTTGDARREARHQTSPQSGGLTGRWLAPATG